MAKKAAKRPARAVPAEPAGKVRFEVRFDEDVYSGVKALADSAQISVNQLMHALARWAVQNCKSGEPDRTEDGFVTGSTKPQPGCIWAGEPGVTETLTTEEIAKAVAEVQIEAGSGYTEAHFLAENGHKRQSKTQRGKVWLFFDFTERRVIRED